MANTMINLENAEQLLQPNMKMYDKWWDQEYTVYELNQKPDDKTCTYKFRVNGGVITQSDAKPYELDTRLKTTIQELAPEIAHMGIKVVAIVTARICGAQVHGIKNEYSHEEFDMKRCKAFSPREGGSNLTTVKEFVKFIVQDTKTNEIKATPNYIHLGSEKYNQTALDKTELFLHLNCDKFIQLLSRTRKKKTKKSEMVITPENADTLLKPSAKLPTKCRGGYNTYRIYELNRQSDGITYTYDIYDKDGVITQSEPKPYIQDENLQARLQTLAPEIAELGFKLVAYSKTCMCYAAWLQEECGRDHCPCEYSCQDNKDLFPTGRQNFVKFIVQDQKTKVKLSTPHYVRFNNTVVCSPEKLYEIENFFDRNLDIIKLLQKIRQK